jgi:hypothetical protein
MKGRTEEIRRKWEDYFEFNAWKMGGGYVDLRLVP